MEAENAHNFDALNQVSDISLPSVKIIGVGGAGNNAVDRLKLDDLADVRLAGVNTDSQALSESLLQEKLLIGRTVTRGLSAGGDAEIGRKAAEMDREALERLVDGCDLVFILAGLGGGTGSGAAPLIAEAAERAGALVVTFVTLPFTYEGARRRQQADEALKLLRSASHAVIPLPNDLLLQQISEDATVMEAFTLADSWIQQGVRSICGMLFSNGLINVDFASLKAALSTHGNKTLFGIGEGQGENAMEDALRSLDQCPLLHLPENRYFRQADSLIINITGGPDLSMRQVSLIMNKLTEKFSSKENTVMGAYVDDNLHHCLRISVLGTANLNATRSARTPAHAPAPVEARFDVSDKPSKKAKDSKVKAGFDPLPTDQGEFSFSEDAETRGLFESATKNLYQGEDLDVPTFLRRGIKISL